MDRSIEGCRLLGDDVAAGAGGGIIGHGGGTGKSHERHRCECADQRPAGILHDILLEGMVLIRVNDASTTAYRRVLLVECARRDGCQNILRQGCFGKRDEWPPKNSLGLINARSSR